MTRDEPDPRIGPIPVAPVDLSGVHRAPCPRCGGATIPGVPACPACGHAPSIDPGIADTTTSRRRTRRPARCRQCGYSLAGLRGGPCPECGTPVTVESRREWDLETSREVSRQAYTQAVAIAAGGFLLGVLVRTATAGWMAGGLFAVGWMVSVAIGISVLLACGAIWMGFSSSVPLAMTQIAAAHAVALGGGLVAGAIGGSTIGIVVGIGLYLALIERFLDLDPFDARCVGLLCAIFHIVLGVAARATGLL